MCHDKWLTPHQVTKGANEKVRIAFENEIISHWNISRTAYSLDVQRILLIVLLFYFLEMHSEIIVIFSSAIKCLWKTLYIILN